MKGTILERPTGLMAADLDANSEAFLERSLRQGTAVLFTGAGFSSEANNVSGTHLPIGSELKELLWNIAFPGEAFDPKSSLGDVFDIASSTAGNQTRDLLHAQLTVAADSIPKFYEYYFRIPWFRIYTLNIDDLEQACNRKFRLGSEMYIISAFRDPLPPPDELSVVHLNGVLDTYPDITFSPVQYGLRTTGSDPVYGALMRDVTAHCTIFVGTDLDEPPLWNQLALRGERREGRELRPRSFLVTPHIPRARAAMLERFNVRHIPLNAEDFSEYYLKNIANEKLPRRILSSARQSPLESVETALGEPPEDPADFLLGREPHWSDISEGFAIERTFEDDLLQVAQDRSNRSVITCGTAGSGKSTTLRRLALSLQEAGQRVYWLRTDSSEPMPQLRSTILANRPDVLVIDVAERFGRRGGQLMAELLESSPEMQIVAAYAAGAFDDLGIESMLTDFSTVRLDVPLLDDRDIERLVDALTKANRLGRLAGKSPNEQRKEVKSRAGRQLLVAMLEATSGEKFEDKIVRECEELPGDLQTAYAVIALATANRYWLPLDDVLAALSDHTAEGLEVVDRLVRGHLVLRNANNTHMARHPVIAREVVSQFRRSGQLAEAYTRLAFVMASKFYFDMPMTRERRLLIKLLNHTEVGLVLGGPVNARQMYSEIEQLLRTDFHFWLQRGSYELERGDIKLAENFLNQARGLRDGDYMVDTEWAYLQLERACRDPRNALASKWLLDGITMSFDIIERSGDRSPNTYVVLADKSVQWVSVSEDSLPDKVALIETVRDALRAGTAAHKGNGHFMRAKEHLEAAYLDLARPTP